VGSIPFCAVPAGGMGLFLETRTLSVIVFFQTLNFSAHIFAAAALSVGKTPLPAEMRKIPAAVPSACFHSSDLQRDDGRGHHRSGP